MLLHDRYSVLDADHVRDLATGVIRQRSSIAGLETLTVPSGLGSFVETLEHGREGHPAAARLTATDARGTGALVDAVAAAAQRQGYVPISVGHYAEAICTLKRELEDRALVLIDRGENEQLGRACLLDAAAGSARPHMLVTVQPAPPATPRVREAHPRFGTAVPPRVVHPEVAPLQARAQRAADFVQTGRHAAAERLLREVASALERRGACSEAAHAETELGWMLLERGRCRDADECGARAARLAEAARDLAAVCAARLLQAWARLESLRLPDAEALARAVVLCAACPDTVRWANVTLAKCLLEQDRFRELRAMEALCALPERTSHLQWLAVALDVAAEALIATGRLFDAGRAVRGVLDRWPSPAPPLATAILHTAHLRVVTATGDASLSRDILRRATLAARTARASLRALRARAIWCNGLAAGGAPEACQEVRRCVLRLGRAAPPLLRRLVERGGHPGTAVRQPRTALDAALAAQMLTLAQADEDAEAVRAVVSFVLEELDASRVDVVSADAGPPSVVIAAGPGPMSCLGPRVLESGIIVGGEAGAETSVPVRCGPRLVAALSARWPSNREPPADRVAVLECAAAVIAGRVDTLHQRARENAAASLEVPELIGVSAATADLRKAILRAARAPFAVMIEGESGVGKELVARAIHQLSPRRDRRFCDVNCAALPDDLLEAELFGHARGAFTGALVERAGLFEEASGGTLFLDEVADLSLRGQAKLLRAVQQQEIRRIGESVTRRVDVRFVAAANREMAGEVEAGRFRADLLYRLDVIHIRIVPLRDRPEDIPVIARHLWQHATGRIGSRAVLSPATLAALTHYAWPGNVRELQNVLAALAVAAPARGQVRPSLLPPVISTSAGVHAGTLAHAREQFERRFIELALARAGGNRSRAAHAIGLSRQGLLKSMVRLGLKQDAEHAARTR